MYEDISPTAFVARRDADEAWQLLDVREAWEFDIASVPQSIRISLAEIPSRHAEIDAARPVAVLCHSGGRSATAAAFLAGQGFSRVANIVGGIDAWAEQVDKSLSRY